MRIIKKVPLLLLALTVVPGLIACGSAQGDDKQPETSREPQTQDGEQIKETEAVEETESEKEKETENMAVFDLENGIVRLNSGYDMPLAGLGAHSLSAGNCQDAFTTFIKNGGRLIDTASYFGAEESIREAIENSGVPRDELFITANLYMNQYEDAEVAIDKLLSALGISYLDLVMLHHPGEHDVEAYLVLEQEVSDGRIRSIGLSNWYVEELEEFLPQVNITPALVQNEIHPYYQENNVIPYIHERGIVVCGWFPFGGLGHTGEVLGNEVITAIAEAHQVTPEQVIIRWNLQKGVIPISSTGSPEQVAANLDVFSFELEDTEIERINALDRNEKHELY